MDLNQLAQSIIAMLVITAPPDPAKLIFFNAIVEREGISRQKAAMKVSLIVASVLAVAAFGGTHIAEVLGITEANVKVRMHRATKQLRVNYQKLNH